MQTAASGGRRDQDDTEITGHFGNQPFQEQELAGHPHAHVVLGSCDVQGGPATSCALYATERTYRESPKA